MFTMQVHIYGICLAVAFASGIILALLSCHRYGITREQVIDLGLITMLAGLFGARALYIILYINHFSDIKSMFALNRGGLVFYGGFAAAALAFAVYAAWQKIDLRLLGDLTAPSLALGQAIGRIGCFLNGCCYGAPSNLPWACVFAPANDLLKRHPTQLYESIFLFLFLAIIYNLRKKRFKAGFVFGFYIESYAVFRFMIEFLRGDDRGGFFTPLHLSVSQVTALVAIAAGVVWLVWCGLGRRDFDRTAEGRRSADGE